MGLVQEGIAGAKAGKEGGGGVVHRNGAGCLAEVRPTDPWKCASCMNMADFYSGLVSDRSHAHRPSPVQGTLRSDKAVGGKAFHNHAKLFFDDTGKDHPTAGA